MAKRKVEPLTHDECLALLAACGKRSPCGCRDRATIALLWRGQLRVSEVLGLLPRDVDLVGGSVRVHDGKGGKARVVGLDAGACELVRAWADRRVKLGLSDNMPLICTLQGRSIVRSQVWGMLRRHARQAGISKRVHPHGLRHTGAFELLREGVALDHIQRQLGHSSLAVTNTYLRHASADDVVQAMRRRSW